MHIYEIHTHRVKWFLKILADNKDSRSNPLRCPLNTYLSAGECNKVVRIIKVESTKLRLITLQTSEEIMESNNIAPGKHTYSYNSPRNLSITQ